MMVLNPDSIADEFRAQDYRRTRLQIAAMLDGAGDAPLWALQNADELMKTNEELPTPFDREKKK